MSQMMDGVLDQSHGWQLWCLSFFSCCSDTKPKLPKGEWVSKRFRVPGSSPPWWGVTVTGAWRELVTSHLGMEISEHTHVSTQLISTHTAQLLPTVKMTSIGMAMTILTCCLSYLLLLWYNTMTRAFNWADGFRASESTVVGQRHGSRRELTV